MHKLHVAVRLVVGTLCKFTAHPLNKLLLPLHITKCLQHLIMKRGAVLKIHDLWEIAYGSVLRHRHGARCRLLQPADYFQHRRLSRAVLSH